MTIAPYQVAAQSLVSNDEQWLAYESDGHFVALAGPGSGKTKVLTTKLARIVNEDVEEPRGIACVTYSNECARELKRRLAELSVRPSRRVFIGTVHSFCFQHIVRPFAHLGGLKIPNPIKVATNDQKKQFFGTAVHNVLDGSANPWHWEIPCSRYRRLHLDRDASDWYEDDKAAAHIIEEYERLLRANSLIDFDDMMLLGLRLVESHDWVRRALTAKFPVLVVDEYQDLGLPLHRIVLSLCFAEAGQSTRLFAVGDPDQSIYGFTGAKPELLRTLSERSDVDDTQLKLNYRSRQALISASEIALGSERGYRANNQDVGLVDFHECENGLEHQAEFIVSSLIPSLLADEAARSLGEIAVLFRTKGEGNIVAEEAASAGLEFIRTDGNAAYQKTPLTRWLEECACWCTANDGESAPLLRDIIREYVGFKHTISTERERLDAIHGLVSLLRDIRGASSLFDWLVQLSDRGLRSHLAADPSRNQELVELNSLIDISGNGGVLTDWSLARFAGQGGTDEHLNLMTLHSSKGLEFDVAILFGMDQGIIPGYRETSTESKREPRRLFYVGLTRARNEVHMTYSGWRRTPWGQRINDGVSEFVVELQERLLSQG